MKQALLGLTLLSAACCVHAKSELTLYGLANVTLRYLSTGAGYQSDNSHISLADGPVTASRWGLKGVEDLGNGHSAFFQLENGFRLQDGVIDPSSGFFNRYAYVGIDTGSTGAISFGGQDTPLFSILASLFDPLTVGNNDQNAWLPAAMSRIRTHNSIRYRNNKYGGPDVILSYSSGSSFRDNKLGQQYGASLAYTLDTLTLGGAYQLTRSDQTNQAQYIQRVWNVDAVYETEEGNRFFLGYFNGRDQTGFVNTVTGISPSIANPPVPGLQRRDDGYFTGVSWRPIPRWTITGAAYFDVSKNIMEEGDHGKRYTLVGVAEYALSKRTQMYVTVDFNKVQDAASGELAGKSSQLGVGTGIRQIF